MPIFTAEERVGQTIAGKYLLERILGEGGMGVVYEARHTTLGRAVAVKFLHPALASDDAVVQRFLNEARAASSLAHPNVVDVLDVGTAEDGAPFIVMERLEGESLASRITRAGPLPPGDARTLLRPAMEAIAFAHERRIVHRDLKPDNVFLHRNAKGEAVTKVLDFGIAKIGEGPAGSGTATGALLGTVFYMAPEQSRGRGVGPWSDVWAMGVVWYETLTGRFPFDVDHDSPTTDVLIRLSIDRPIPIATHAPSISRSVAAVLDRALTQDVSERYRNMAEMLRALDAGFEASGEPETPAGLATTLGEAPVIATASRAGARALGIGGAMLGLIAMAAIAAFALGPRVTQDAASSPVEDGLASAIALAPELHGGEPVRPTLARGVDPPELPPASSAPPAPSAADPPPAPSAVDGLSVPARRPIVPRPPRAPDPIVAAPDLAPVPIDPVAAASTEDTQLAVRARPLREEVLAAMTRIAPTLHACGEYQHGIARVRIYIAGASGRVTRAVITGALSGTLAGGCVARAIRGVSLEPFGDREFMFAYPIDI